MNKDITTFLTESRERIKKAHEDGTLEPISNIGLEVLLKEMEQEYLHLYEFTLSLADEALPKEIVVLISV